MFFHISPLIYIYISYLSISLLLLNSIVSAFFFSSCAHWEITKPHPLSSHLICLFLLFLLPLIYLLSLRHEDQCPSIIQLQQGACHSPAILFFHHYNIYLLPQVFTSLILPYPTFFSFFPRLEYLVFVSSGHLRSLSSCGLLLSFNSIHYLIIFSLHLVCCYGCTSTTGQNAPFSSISCTSTPPFIFLLPLSFPHASTCPSYSSVSSA